jgi:hypothetical protein
MNPNLTSALTEFTKSPSPPKAAWPLSYRASRLFTRELSLITRARLRLGKREGRGCADRGAIDASHARALAWLDGPH